MNGPLTTLLLGLRDGEAFRMGVQAEGRMLRIHADVRLRDGVLGKDLLISRVQPESARFDLLAEEIAQALQALVDAR